MRCTPLYPGAASGSHGAPRRTATGSAGCRSPVRARRSSKRARRSRCSGAREVFRSAGRFRATNVFALVGPHALAFSYERYRPGSSTEALYLAPLHGHERRIAAGEWPLGWTRSGDLLTWHAGGEDAIGVDLRDDAGALRRRVGAGLREIRFDPASHSMLALSPSGLLERYDGRWHGLVDLHALGFGRHVTFERLSGGLIGVLEDTRLAVVRGDGSLFASARFRPRVGAFAVAGESGLVANAAGTAVAFATSAGDNRRGSGRESIYVLRAGERRASKLYGAAIDFVVCERWATLAWHRGWLLYATPEGRTLLLDSRTPRRRVDLTALIRSLAPVDDDRKVTARVSWSKTS